MYRRHKRGVGRRGSYCMNDDVKDIIEGNVDFPDNEPNKKDEKPPILEFEIDIPEKPLEIVSFEDLTELLKYGGIMERRINPINDNMPQEIKDKTEEIWNTEHKSKLPDTTIDINSDHGYTEEELEGMKYVKYDDEGNVTEEKYIREYTDEETSEIRKNMTKAYKDITDFFRNLYVSNPEMFKVEYVVEYTKMFPEHIFMQFGVIDNHFNEMVDNGIVKIDMDFNYNTKIITRYEICENYDENILNTLLEKYKVVE